MPVENFRDLVANHFRSQAALARAADVKIDTLKYILMRGRGRAGTAKALARAYGDAAGLSIDQAMALLWRPLPQQVMEVRRRSNTCGS